MVLNVMWSIVVDGMVGIMVVRMLDWLYMDLYWDEVWHLVLVHEMLMVAVVVVMDWDLEWNKVWHLVVLEVSEIMGMVVNVVVDVVVNIMGLGLLKSLSEEVSEVW